MKRFCKTIFLLACAVLLGTSCASQRKLAYLGSVTPETADSINHTYQSVREARILCGDMLTITVNAMDMEAVQAFNLPVANNLRVGSIQTATSGGSLQYYTVDKDGNIDFPVLGKVHVEGLTISEAKELLREQISQSVREPIINIHFANYHVTVLGEVKNPGVHSITGERVTILEALGKAGDMTIYGKRNNVLVTRENADGKIEFARLDLTSPDIFTSPYYFLQQNDVVYVSPNHARGVASENVSFYLSLVSTVCTTTTVIVSIVKATGK